MSTKFLQLPPRVSIEPSEHSIQKAFFEWCAWKSKEKCFECLDLFFAIPNGGVRHIGVARKLKAEGVKAGVPDTCLPVARGGFNALYIEFKRKDGVLRPSQKEMIERMILAGNAVIVVNDLDSAIQFIEKYVRGEIAK